MPEPPLPAKFTHGKRTSVCLVYFAPDHGKLAAVSFRPTQDFDAITWQPVPVVEEVARRAEPVEHHEFGRAAVARRTIGACPRSPSAR